MEHPQCKGDGFPSIFDKRHCPDFISIKLLIFCMFSYQTQACTYDSELQCMNDGPSTLGIRKLYFRFTKTSVYLSHPFLGKCSSIQWDSPKLLNIARQLAQHLVEYKSLTAVLLLYNFPPCYLCSFILASFFLCKCQYGNN